MRYFVIVWFIFAISFCAFLIADEHIALEVFVGLIAFFAILKLDSIITGHFDERERR